MPRPHAHNLSAYTVPLTYSQPLAPTLPLVAPPTLPPVVLPTLPTVAPPTLPTVAPPRPQMRSIALPDRPSLHIQLNPSIRHGDARCTRFNLASLHAINPTARATRSRLADMTIFCYDIVAEGEPIFVRPSGGRKYVTVDDVLASIERWLQGTPRMMPPVNPAAQALPSWALCVEEGPSMAGIRRLDILALKGISRLDGLSVGTSGTSFNMHLI